MTFDPLTYKLLQEALRNRGHYAGNIDGIWGPISRAALEAYRNAELGRSAFSRPTPGGKADDRSEKIIATLIPEVQETFRTFILRAKTLVAPLDVKAISGHRTYAEQAELYRKYLAGGPQAAPAGHSNHNFGLAIDLGIFDTDGTYVDGRDSRRSSLLYLEIARVVGDPLGVEWGGDWQRSDPPHFQIRPTWAAGMSESAMLAALRGGRKFTA